MNLIEINRNIEAAKTGLELSRTEQEAAKYKSILLDLRTEKRKILKNLWK